MTISKQFCPKYILLQQNFSCGQKSPAGQFTLKYWTLICAAAADHDDDDVDDDGDDDDDDDDDVPLVTNRKRKPLSKLIGPLSMWSSVFVTSIKFIFIYFPLSQQLNIYNS